MDRKLEKDRLLKQKKFLEMKQRARNSRNSYHSCEMYTAINPETGEINRNYNLTAANKQSLIKASEGQRQFARRTIKLKKPE